MGLWGDIHTQIIIDTNSILTLICDLIKLLKNQFTFKIECSEKNFTLKEIIFQICINLSPIPSFCFSKFSYPLFLRFKCALY